MAKKQAENFKANLASLCAGYGAVSQLADSLGVHRVTMSRIRHGHRAIDLELAESIARHYGHSLSDMLVAPTNFRKMLAAS